MALETTGLAELDARLGGGVPPAALLGLCGPAGSGKQSLAVAYALAHARCCCLSPLPDPPYLPPGQASEWARATHEGRIQFTTMDLLDEEEADTCAAVERLLAGGWRRFVVLHAEMLACLVPRAEVMRLVYMLKRAKASAMLVADDVSPAGGAPAAHPWEGLADVILRTARVGDGATRRHRLTAPKPPSPEMDVAPLEFVVEPAGPRALERPLPRGRASAAAGASGAPAVRTSAQASVFTVMPELFHLDKEQEATLRRRVDAINGSQAGTVYRVPASPYAGSVEYNQHFERFRQGEKLEDLFIIDVYRLRECVEKGLVQPLDGWVSEQWRQQFLPQALQACTYKGQLWAIPHWINAGVMIYRRDILERHGLEAPRTHEELVETTRRALGAERRPASQGFAFQGAVAEALSCSFLEFLWNHGGDIYTHDDRPRIHEREGLEALRFMHDLVHVHGVSPEETPFLTEADTYRMFWQDKLLILRNWPNFLCRRPGRERVSPAARVGMAPLPTRDASRAPQAVLGGFAYVVPARVESPEPLLRFHSLLYDERGIEQSALDGWACSPFRAVYANPRVLAARPYYAALPDILAMGRSRQEITSYHRLTTVLREEVNLVLRKLRTPEEALETIAGKLELHVLRQAETNRLQETIDYLRANLHLELSREDVAARCKLNPSYFSSLFKDVTGETFRRFVNRERVQKAQRLLASTEQSVGSIARAVGFSDPSYFSQVFREFTGLTPLQHRAQALRRVGHH